MTLIRGTYDAAKVSGTAPPIKDKQTGDLVMDAFGRLVVTVAGGGSTGGGSGTASTVAQGAPTATPATGAWPTKVVDAAGAMVAFALDTTLAAVRDRLPAALVGGRLAVDGSGVTQPVSQGAPAAAPATGAWFTKLVDAAGTLIAPALDATLQQVRDRLPAALTGGRLAVDGSAVTQPVSQGAPAGTPSTGAWFMRLVDGGGTLISVASGRLVVDGSQVTQPISAAAGALVGIALDATVAAIRDRLPAALVNGRLSVDGSGVTQPVSAASLPLPAGAAQEHVSAAAPHAVRLTDGTAFYNGATATSQATEIALMQASTNALTWPTPLSVGTSAVSLGTGTFPRGIVVQSDPTNTANMRIGASGVTMTSGGFVLVPGASVYADVQNLASLFAVSSAAAQLLNIQGRS